MSATFETWDTGSEDTLSTSSNVRIPTTATFSSFCNFQMVFSWFYNYSLSENIKHSPLETVCRFPLFHDKIYTIWSSSWRFTTVYSQFPQLVEYWFKWYSCLSSIMDVFIIPYGSRVTILTLSYRVNLSVWQ